MKWYNGFSPERRAQAARWIRREIEAGRIPAPAACCACGQSQGTIDYHAEDYSVPFGAHLTSTPLCYRCHMMLHLRFRSPAGWKAYRDAIRAGWTFAPIFGRSFGTVAGHLAAIEQEAADQPQLFDLRPAHRGPGNEIGVIGQARERTFLDTVD